MLGNILGAGDIAMNKIPALNVLTFPFEIWFVLPLPSDIKECILVFSDIYYKTGFLLLQLIIDMIIFLYRESELIAGTVMKYLFFMYFLPPSLLNFWFNKSNMIVWPIKFMSVIVKNKTILSLWERQMDILLSDSYKWAWLRSHVLCSLS